MPRTGKVTTLEQVLDRVESKADEQDETSVGDMMDAVGDRSFGPILLLPGLVMLAPVVGDIPGVPVLMGSLVVLTAAQLLLRRDHVWLPQWLLKRSVSASTAQKTIGWLRPVGCFLDRWTKPRLDWLLHRAGVVVIAVACIVIASATPLMEVVPMTANVAGAAITAYGLALTARDGVMALVALVFSAGAFGILIAALL